MCASLPRLRRPTAAISRPHRLEPRAGTPASGYPLALTISQRTALHLGVSDAQPKHLRRRRCQRLADRPAFAICQRQPHPIPSHLSDAVALARVADAVAVRVPVARGRPRQRQLHLSEWLERILGSSGDGHHDHVQ